MYSDTARHQLVVVMSKREVAALQDKGIRVGDTVRTAYRGGVREG